MIDDAPWGLVLLGGAGLLLLVWCVVIHNRLISLRQHIRESWSDIDVEMKRRYDLIPNLMHTVQGYMGYERGVLESLTAARSRAMANHGDPALQGETESALQIALGRVFALTEGYPQLRANEQFLALQRELANTEDRIAAARRFFNANVRDFNQLCEMFPSSAIARLKGFQPTASFELSSEAERVVPRIGMDELGGASAARRLPPLS